MNDCDLIVKANLTIDGYRFVGDYKRDKSITDTNKIITSQTKRQTKILIGALLISLLSGVVSLLNYLSTNNNSAKRQYLLPSKELIEQLKRSLPIKDTLPLQTRRKKDS